jgi:hypothetical protein
MKGAPRLQELAADGVIALDGTSLAVQSDSLVRSVAAA